MVTGHVPIDATHRESDFMNCPSATLSVLDLHPSDESFLAAVVSGLSGPERTLPCKYFYDRRGSKLFDQICELDEYYVMRAERAIMEASIDDIAGQLGSDVMLIEYGSGSSIKTRLLLDTLVTPAAYVPVDISKDHLLATSRELADAYPLIEVLPVCADFVQPFELPTSQRTPSRRVVYFPGSTIGNFTPSVARRILGQIATVVGHDGGLLIGIDLQKPIAVLQAAYNDRRGVTAAFNLNLLARINRELDASIDVNQFYHHARYNDQLNRIEMQLISRVDQTIQVGEHLFDFRAGDVITTEHSHKYSIDGFTELASRSGFELHQSWTDAENRFAVLHLVRVAGRSTRPPRR